MEKERGFRSSLRALKFPSPTTKGGKGGKGKQRPSFGTLLASPRRHFRKHREASPRSDSETREKPSLRATRSLSQTQDGEDCSIPVLLRKEYSIKKSLSANSREGLFRSCEWPRPVDTLRSNTSSEDSSKEPLARVSASRCPSGPELHDHKREEMKNRKPLASLPPVKSQSDEPIAPRVTLRPKPVGKKDPSKRKSRYDSATTFKIETLCQENRKLRAAWSAQLNESKELRKGNIKLAEQMQELRRKREREDEHRKDSFGGLGTAMQYSDLIAGKYLTSQPDPSSGVRARPSQAARQAYLENLEVLDRASLEDTCRSLESDVSELKQHLEEKQTIQQAAVSHLHQALEQLVQVTDGSDDLKHKLSVRTQRNAMEAILRNVTLSLELLDRPKAKETPSPITVSPEIKRSTKVPRKRNMEIPPDPIVENHKSPRGGQTKKEKIPIANRPLDRVKYSSRSRVGSLPAQNLEEYLATLKKEPKLSKNVKKKLSGSEPYRWKDLTISVGDLHASSKGRSRSFSDLNLSSWEMPTGSFPSSTTLTDIGLLTFSQRDDSEMTSEISTYEECIGRALHIATSDDGKPVIHSGDILALFEYVIKKTSDFSDLECFFIGFRQFITPERLLLFMENNCISTGWDDDEMNCMVSTLKYWTLHYPSDFIESTYFSLKEFLTHPPLQKLHGADIDVILNHISAFSARAGSSDNVWNLVVPPAKQDIQGGKIELLSLSPAELARQCTLLEFSMFQAINPVDLTTPERRESSQEIRALIHRFNRVSSWVATEILVTPNVRKRASVIKHFILMAQHSLDLHNYNTLLEITAGLNFSSVRRLRKTWKMVPSKYIQILKDLEELMDCRANFIRYRDALRSADLPCFPYFGIFLRDCSFVDVGNETTMPDGTINFEKMKMNGIVVRSLQFFQKSPYLFPRLAYLQNYLKNLTAFEECVLQKYSSQYERPAEV